MKQSKTSNEARGVTLRHLAEIVGFLALAMMTATSAAMMKHQRVGAPALVAMDSVAAPVDVAQPFIAATIEQRTATVVASNEVEQSVEAAEAPEHTRVTIEFDEDENEPALESSEIRFFDGRRVRPARTIWMTVTAYSPDHRSCGIWADGVTASNKSVWTNGMKLIAADTRLLPFGTLLSVPGYDGGSIVPVLDRGGAIKGKRLDVLYPTHEIALQWGVQRLPVTVWEYVD